MSTSPEVRTCINCSHFRWQPDTNGWCSHPKQVDMGWPYGRGTANPENYLNACKKSKGHPLFESRLAECPKPEGRENLEGSVQDATLRSIPTGAEELKLLRVTQYSSGYAVEALHRRFKFSCKEDAQTAMLLVKELSSVIVDAFLQTGELPRIGKEE